MSWDRCARQWQVKQSIIITVDVDIHLVSILGSHAALCGSGLQPMSSAGYIHSRKRAFKASYLRVCTYIYGSFRQ